MPRKIRIRAIQGLFALGVCSGLVRCGGGKGADSNHSGTLGNGNADASAPDDGGSNGANNGAAQSEDSGAPMKVDVPPDPCDDSRDCDLGVCNTDENICVECIGNGDCNDDAYCRKHECLPDRACDSNDDCKEFDQLCDMDAGRCVDCTEHSHCEDAEYCDEGGCETDTCEPDETSCLDGELISCSEVGNWALAVDGCIGDEICEIDGDAARCVNADGECELRAVDLIWIYAAGESFIARDGFGEVISATFDELSQAGVDTRVIVLAPSLRVVQCHAAGGFCVDPPLSTGACGDSDYHGDGAEYFRHPPDLRPAPDPLLSLIPAEDVPAWASFLRPDVPKRFLVIDIDDSTPEQVQEFKDDIEQLRIPSNLWSMGGAFCTEECETLSTCQEPAPLCYPAPNLTKLQQETGGPYTSLCVGDPEDLVEPLAQQLIAGSSAPGCP